MSIIEYSQRLLNAGQLDTQEVQDILAGKYTEQELRTKYGKLPPDTHPARTAVIEAAKAIPDALSETTLYADYVELFTASLTRFLHLDALIVPTPVSVAEIEKEDGMWAVAQHITGDVSIVDGLLARDEVFLTLASRYSGEDLKEVDSDAIDSLEEFLNVINGLYIVQLANRKIEPDLDFPLSGHDIIPRGSHQLVLRLYTEAGDFLLILSADAFL